MTGKATVAPSQPVKVQVGPFKPGKITVKTLAPAAAPTNQVASDSMMQCDDMKSDLIMDDLDDLDDSDFERDDLEDCIQDLKS